MTKGRKMPDKRESGQPVVEKLKNKGKDTAGAKSLNFSFTADHCEACKKEVGNEQEALQCDLCNLWHHTSCENIESDEYKMITKVANKISWFCNKYQDKQRKMYDDFKKIKN